MSIENANTVAINTVQMSSSFTSLIASSTVATMILRRKDGALSTPYRRIIFGLSVADIIQSLGFVTGPLMVPADTPGSLPIFNNMGNTASCEANAFFVTFGSTAVPMYTCALGIYYLCKIKFNMHNATVLKVERVMHFFIITFNLIPFLIGVTANSFNALGTGGICSFAGYPLFCDLNPDEYGECTRGATAYKYTLIFTFLPHFISLFVISVTMIMLCCHVCCQGRIIQSQGEALTQTDTDTDNFDNEEKSCIKSCCSCSKLSLGRMDVLDDLRQREDETLNHFARRVQRVYIRETMKQATLYFVAFILVYLPAIMIAIAINILRVNSITNEAIIIILFVYPLGGVFNIVVYTRPKVIDFLSRHPEYSFTGAFFEVIKAGGDLPDESSLQREAEQQSGSQDERFCHNFCCPKPLFSELSMPEFAEVRRRGRIDRRLRLRQQTQNVGDDYDGRDVLSSGLSLDMIKQHGENFSDVSKL